MLLGMKTMELGFKVYGPKPVKKLNESDKKDEKKPTGDSPSFSITPSRSFAIARNLIQSPQSGLSSGSSPSLIGGTVFSPDSTNTSLNTSSWTYYPNNGSANNSNVTPSQSSSNIRRRNILRTSPTEIIKDKSGLRSYLLNYEHVESKLEELRDLENKSPNDAWSLNSSGGIHSRSSINYQPADDSFILGSEVDAIDDHSGLSPVRSRESVISDNL